MENSPDLIEFIQPFVKQRLWRQSFTDGVVEDVYSAGGGTGEVEIVVIEIPNEETRYAGPDRLRLHPVPR